MLEAVVSADKDDTAQKPARSVGNSPSMAAAWLLLAAGGALFFAGRVAPLEMAHLVFFSLSIGSSNSLK